jgi:hypothetical protein
VPATAATALALFAGAWESALGGALLLALNVGLIVAVGILTVLAAAGRRGLRPLLLLPVVIVAVVGLRLRGPKRPARSRDAPQPDDLLVRERLTEPDDQSLVTRQQGPAAARSRSRP